ncbi:hypothetical protein [Curtobacterium sp. MCPF17_021]|uniref:hypothetical protein n=1 Tax=Curtobacterium sp. MCPF17_021 TaxID=2175639 RepID=UPI0011B4D8AE|nr:hypothetical protein [Curtobacterium sp. MCPF17_021]WIE83706.1 hypothetical protein DEJ29_002345 [Curtobacterium sp. MCPF17_021]
MPLPVAPIPMTPTEVLPYIENNVGPILMGLGIAIMITLCIYAVILLVISIVAVVSAAVERSEHRRGAPRD